MWEKDRGSNKFWYQGKLGWSIVSLQSIPYHNSIFFSSFQRI